MMRLPAAPLTLARIAKIIPTEEPAIPILQRKVGPEGGGDNLPVRSPKLRSRSVGECNDES